jgi:hypothetical protein
MREWEIETNEWNPSASSGGERGYKWRRRREPLVGEFSPIALEKEATSPPMPKWGPSRHALGRPRQKRPKWPSLSGLAGGCLNHRAGQAQTLYRQTNNYTCMSTARSNPSSRQTNTPREAMTKSSGARQRCSDRPSTAPWLSADHQLGPATNMSLTARVESHMAKLGVQTSLRVK